MTSSHGQEIHRRHLTEEQRGALVARVLKHFMTREKAEALTEIIRRRLDQTDQACIDLLADGVPPAMLAEAVTQSWAKVVRQFNDAEFADAMWEHIVSPRVAAILSWNGGDS